MGRFLLVGRLAARDLRRRPAEAALLLLAITAATTTLTLGLVLRDVASDPYQRTREATAGADVVAAAFADALGVRAGDRITLNGRSFQVIGLAVTAAVAPYPSMSPTGTAENPLQYCVPYPDPCDQRSETGGDPSPELLAAWRRIDAEHPGLVWLTQSDARSLAPQAESLSYVFNLKLDDPAQASAFVNTYLPSGRSPEVISADGPSLQSWQQIRDQIAADLERNEQQVLLIGSRLLTL